MNPDVYCPYCGFLARVGVHWPTVKACSVPGGTPTIDKR